MPVLVAILLLVIGVPAADAYGQGASLGPKDPAKLPPGSQAPDFTLESLSGPPVTLSQFRGKQNVVLVFYRGHW
jgi:cytochrome oxidase Cu insertion factor (SCO1/SenC/PrrC family)